MLIEVRMKQVSSVDMHFVDTQFKHWLSYCPMLADSSWFLYWYLEREHDQFLTDFACFFFIIFLTFNLTHCLVLSYITYK